MTVFDIGANVGTHALPIAATVGDSGMVVCFEPHSETFNGLVANVERNRAENVQTEQFALGATTGTTELFIEHNESGVGSHSLCQRNPQFETTECIDVTTGDEFVSSRGLVPDLMKIDVEGGETDVLNGFRNTLAKHHPVLSIEIHASVSHEEIRNELAEYGYSLSKMSKRKNIVLAE